jgi:hypothetical protein
MQMRWFRSQGRASAGVALFALLIQLAVSFGHIHLEPAHFDAAGEAAATATDIAKTDPHGDDDRTDRACAICILNQLVGAAQTVAAPEISVAPLARSIAPTFVSGQIATDPPPAAFRSRAPPLA